MPLGSTAVLSPGDVQCTGWILRTGSVHFSSSSPDVDTPESRPLSVPGESLEETVSREVAEEVGLEVHNISYSSSQHWPFPRSSLMLGCHALVSPAHTQVSAR